MKMDLSRDRRFLVESLLLLVAKYVQFVSEKQGVLLLMEFLEMGGSNTLLHQQYNKVQCTELSTLFI